MGDLKLNSNSYQFLKQHDVNGDNKLDAKELAGMADVNKNGEVSFQEAGRLEQDLSKYIKDQSLVRDLALASMTGSKTTVSFVQQDVRDLKFTNVTNLSNDAKAEIYQNAEALYQKTDSFKFYNGPADPPFFLETPNAGETLNVELDRQRPISFNWPPESIKMNHPITGKEIEAFKFVLETGDEMVIPKGQPLNLQTYSGMYGNTTVNYRIDAQGNFSQETKQSENLARYSTVFCTRKTRI